MRQTGTILDKNRQQLYFDYLSLFFTHMGQGLIGAVWIFFFGLFIRFIYDYNRYYDLGVRQKQKAYASAYKSFEKIARKIVVCFIVFLIITLVVCWTDYEDFLVCLMKGALIDIIVIPLVHLHYGDETKYKFKNLWQSPDQRKRWLGKKTWSIGNIKIKIKY